MRCRSSMLMVQALLCCAVGCGPTIHYPPKDTNPRREKPTGRDYTADLKSPKTDVRRDAAAFLGDPGNKAAVQPLIGALKDSDAKVRAAAARSLGVIGPADAKEAIGPLTDALKDSDDDVKSQAAEALCNFKHDAKPAVAALIDLYKATSNGNVRVQVANALKHIDSDAAEKAGVPLP